MHRILVIAPFFAVISLLLTGPAHAQIVTDRPDVAESSQTVGRDRLQVETGASVEVDEAPAGVSRSQLHTPTKLRFGIAERLELHIEASFFNMAWSSETQGSEAGVGAIDVDEHVPGNDTDE